MAGEGVVKYRVSNGLVTPCSGCPREGALCGLRPSVSQQNFSLSRATSVGVGLCNESGGERFPEQAPLQASSRCYAYGKQRQQEFYSWVKNTCLIICLHLGMRSLAQ